MAGDRELMRAPKGMLDVLPPESGRWQELVARFATRATRFGYGLLVTPVVEHYEVFQRVGETTDVIRKEMYDFDDKGGRRLALRPEGTAPVVRAFVEHRPATPWKVWYLAPNFRYERPQAGRYRQHWQEMLERAPQLGEYLNEPSATHFARVQEGLRLLGIPFEIAPRLVRGFDYYTSTVFEFAAESLDSAQNAIGGGGRYDRLAQEMGGPPAPSIGFGCGIERILLACDAEGVFPVKDARVDVFVVDMIGTPDAARLLAELRETGLAADRAYGGRSAKKQMAAANSAGASWTVIIGAREAEQGLVALRDMATGDQSEVKRDEVAALLYNRKETTPR